MEAASAAIDATSARDAASAILNDLQEKGLIGTSGA
jgi:hypothetical protein